MRYSAYIDRFVLFIDIYLRCLLIWNLCKVSFCQCIIQNHAMIMISVCHSNISNFVKIRTFWLQSPVGMIYLILSDLNDFWLNKTHICSALYFFFSFAEKIFTHSIWLTNNIGVCMKELTIVVALISSLIMNWPFLLERNLDRFFVLICVSIDYVSIFFSINDWMIQFLKNRFN